MPCWENEIDNVAMNRFVFICFSNFVLSSILRGTLLNFFFARRLFLKAATVCKQMDQWLSTERQAISGFNPNQSNLPFSNLYI